MSVSWENCKTTLISRLLTVRKCWHRYSNTLLVSLNNRISIRKVSSASEALPTYGTLAPLTSKVHPSAVHVELEVITDARDQEKVEGRSGQSVSTVAYLFQFGCLCSIPGPEQWIWILSGKTSSIEITSTESIIISALCVMKRLRY